MIDNYDSSTKIYPLLHGRSDLRQEVERRWNENKVNFPEPLRYSYFMGRNALLCRSRIDQENFTSLAKRVCLIPFWLKHAEEDIYFNKGIGVNFPCRERTLSLSVLLNKWGDDPVERYAAYLSLFVAHGALFQDVRGNEPGDASSCFTGDVFEQAARKIEGVYGVNPLLVKPWYQNVDTDLLVG